MSTRRLFSFSIVHKLSNCKNYLNLASLPRTLLTLFVPSASFIVKCLSIHLYNEFGIEVGVLRLRLAFSMEKVAPFLHAQNRYAKTEQAALTKSENQLPTYFACGKCKGSQVALVAHIIDSVWPASAPSLQLHSIPCQTRFRSYSTSNPARDRLRSELKSLNRESQAAIVAPAPVSARIVRETAYVPCQLGLCRFSYAVGCNKN